MGRAAPAGIRILGIDPGSRVAGYGLIESRGGRFACLDHGVIRLGQGAVALRLHKLFGELGKILTRLRPDEVAMEDVFVKRNVASALVLGQARGAAVCAVAEAGFEVHEYAPASIKQAVSGSGRADKSQMQRMVRVLLNLPSSPPADAADALACALCHAQSRTYRLHAAKLHGDARR